MNIIRKSADNLTMKDLYNLTKSPEIQKMSTVVNQELEIAQFIIYEDQDAKGNTQIITSIRTTDSETFATNSPTFTREFSDICTMCEEANEPMPSIIKVASGVSRGGRTFITCVYIK